MTWFIFSILSIFVVSAAELTQQYLLNSKNSFDAKTSTVVTCLFEFFIVVPFIFIFGLANQLSSIFDPAIFPRVLLVTFITSIAIILYFKSFKVKNISISLILFSLSTIVSTFLGVIFFAESTNYLKFFGIALILIAIVVVNYKNTALEKNHWFGLVSGFIFGICYTLDKSIIIDDIHPLVYIFWDFLLIAFWGFVLGARSVISAVKNKRVADYKPILFSAIGYLLYNFFTFTAYRFGGSVGKIDAINNADIFLIILFEFFILKHTQGVARKLFSAGLALVGIAILGFVE